MLRDYEARDNIVEDFADFHSADGEKDKPVIMIAPSPNTDYQLEQTVSWCWWTEPVRGCWINISMPRIFALWRGNRSTDAV